MSSAPPSPSQAPPKSRVTPAEVIARARVELEYGARVILHAHLSPPPHEARARRFLWGLTLPFGVLREVLRDPVLRKRWLQVTGAQIIVIFAVASFALKFSEVSFHHFGELLATVYTTVCVVEWIVIACSREYHDELSALAAQATSVPGEPLGRHPRVHVDFRWLWIKLKRRVRAVLLIASGVPLLAVVLLVPRAGDPIYAVLTTVWAFYWLSVFAVGATSFAWSNPEPTSRAPWFLRPFEAAGRIPVVGWPFRAYAWLWRKVTSSVHAPCEVHSRAAYEGAGLALARAITGFPGLYLFLRPVYPVAATHVVLARYNPPPG